MSDGGSSSAAMTPAVAYKDALKADLKSRSPSGEVIDVGCHGRVGPRTCPWPWRLRGTVTEGRADRALLICGAGLGVAMSANKVPGIRACDGVRQLLGRTVGG